MCQINDLQIVGSQWDANGDPSSISVEVRASGCQFLEFRVFRAQGDTTPLYSASNRPVSGGLARAQFAVTTGKTVHCGEVLWVEVRCQTDPTCLAREEVLVTCKGFEGAECPAAGPPLSIQPPIDANADCVAGGTYVVTIGGTWPTGTTFNWSLGDLPPGVTSPTTQHSQTFTLSHPVGSPSRILIAEVEMPGCPDVQSVVVFPPADGASCPTQIDMSVIGNAGVLPVPADGMTYTGLAPGAYLVRVTSPTGASVSYEWYRDNVLQPSTPSTPNELAIAALPAGAITTVAVRVEQECCNALLDTVVLQTRAADDGGTPGGGGTTTPPTDPNDPTTNPPNVTPPNWPCLVLGVVVALAMIAALVGLVVLAVPVINIPALPTFVITAIGIIVAGVLLLLICNPSLCRLLRIVAWSLKWSIVLGAVIAIGAVSLSALLLVLVYGMMAAATVWLIARNNCQEPSMFSLP
jgi:hypothetical protein